MMQSEMIHTDRVLIVEGKYDAVRLAHLTDAMILLTDGFGIYRDKQRQQLFRALAQKNGLILLTDSDAAGFRIRNYITNMVGILMLESVMTRSSRVLSMSISRPSFVNEQVNWESASLSPHPPAVVSGG